MPEALDIVCALLSLCGAFLFLASAIGVLRLPDFHSRMHAPTKAATLGLAFLTIGSLVPAWAQGVDVRWGVDLLLLLLVFITLPVSAEALSRSTRPAQSKEHEEAEP